MRKIIVVVFIFCMIFSLVACDNDYESSALLKSVLLGDAQFYDTDRAESLSIGQYFEAYYNDAQRWDLLMEIREFTLIDLDMDGADEAVLVVYVEGGLYPAWYIILHHEDETVYGVTITYRGFRDLKQDGTFTFSGGASDSGIGSLKFANNVFTVEKATYNEGIRDADGNYLVSYYVNKREASEDEFNTAWRNQEKKVDAKWVAFTGENINGALSD